MIRQAAHVPQIACPERAARQPSLIAQEKGAEWLRPAPAAVSFARSGSRGLRRSFQSEGQGEIGQTSSVSISVEGDEHGANYQDRGPAVAVRPRDP